MNGDDWPQPNRGIDYDKGENRHKHCGRSKAADVVYEYGKWVGKCPRGFPLDLACELVQGAIPEYRSTQPDKPYRLWSYHDGAIYVAFTSDGGKSWHGFPAKDAPPLEIKRALKARACAVEEETRIKNWLERKWQANP